MVNSLEALRGNKQVAFLNGMAKSSGTSPVEINREAILGLRTL